MSKGNEYVKFSFDCRGVIKDGSTTYNHMIYTKLEKLPVNKSNGRVGDIPDPQWLKNLKSARQRECDYAYTALKQFDFLFDVTQSRPKDTLTLDNLIIPRKRPSDKQSHSDRNTQIDALISNAVNFQRLSRVTRDGGQDRITTLGAKKKVDLTREIRASVRYQVKACNNDFSDHKIAQRCYARIFWLHEAVIRGEMLFSLGRRPDIISSINDGDRIIEIGREISAIEFPLFEEFRTAALLSYSSGVNLSEIWPNLAKIRSRLEVFSALGRISLNQFRPEDAKSLLTENNYHDRGDHLPVKITPINYINHELSNLYKFMTRDFDRTVSALKSSEPAKLYRTYFDFCKAVGLDLLNDKDIEEYNNGVESFLKGL